MIAVLAPVQEAALERVCEPDRIAAAHELIRDVHALRVSVAAILVHGAQARGMTGEAGVVDDEALSRSMLVDRRRAAVHQRGVPDQYFAAAGESKLRWYDRAFGDHWRLLPEAAGRTVPDAYHTVLAILLVANLCLALRDTFWPAPSIEPSGRGQGTA